MSDLLEGTRARLGEPPRRLIVQALDAPAGLSFNHPWWPAHAEFRQVLRDGSPQLAVVALAPPRLANASKSSAFVTMLLPPASARKPVPLESMLAVSEDLDAVLNGPEPIDAEIKSLVSWVHDTTTPLKGYDLPRSVARFQPLRLMRAVVYPELLLRQRLVSWFLPVMVDPERACVSMIPSGCWGEDFKRTWLEAGLSLSR